MTTGRPFGVLVLVAWCGGLLAGEARAQAAAFPALFGGSLSDTAAPRSLDATVTVAGAYTNNGDLDSQPNVSIFDATGFFTSATGNLAYLWQNQRVQFGATGGGEVRYYPQQQAFLNVSQYAGVGFSASFARRTTISVNQTVAYTPAYFAGWFPSFPAAVPGEATAAGGDYATSDLNALSYETSASFGHGLTRAGTLSFFSSFRSTQFDEASGYEDLQAYSVGGRFDQRLSRYATLRLGYAYRQGQFAFVSTDRQAAFHDLDIGVDYGRPLASFRRTEIDFNVGSSIFSQPIADTEQRLQYRLVGRVGVNHGFSRTWRARAEYSRGFGFVEGLPAPVFADAVTGSLDGFLNRRVDVTAMASYSNGTVGTVAISTADQRLIAYTATGRLRVALNRTWAAFGECFYYHYDLGQAVLVPIGVSPFMDRSGVRAGLTLWVPFVRR